MRVFTCECVREVGQVCVCVGAVLIAEAGRYGQAELGILCRGEGHGGSYALHTITVS